MSLASGPHLTEQAGLLENVVDSALSFYGVEAVKKAFVSDSYNKIFRIETDARTYALRIHRPGNHKTEAILGELYWLQALRDDLDLLVPEPVPTLDGSLILTLPDAPLPASSQIVLFKWLSGELLDDHISNQTLEMAGGFMAGLHKHAEQFVLPDELFRPHANYKGLQIWQSPSLLNHYNIKVDHLTKADYALCVETATAVTELVHQFNGPEDYGLIHGDLHQWNLLFQQGRLGALDFDDCLVGSFCLDLAIPLSYLDHRQDYEQLKDSFMQGYTAVRPEPKNCESGVSTFMVVRALDMISWVLGWPQINRYSFGPDLLQNSLARLHRYHE